MSRKIVSLAETGGLLNVPENGQEPDYRMMHMVSINKINEHPEKLWLFSTFSHRMGSRTSLKRTDPAPSPRHAVASAQLFTPNRRGTMLFAGTPFRRRPEIASLYICGYDAGGHRYALSQRKSVTKMSAFRGFGLFVDFTGRRHKKRSPEGLLS